MALLSSGCKATVELPSWMAIACTMSTNSMHFHFWSIKIYSVIPLVRIPCFTDSLLRANVNCLSGMYLRLNAQTERSWLQWNARLLTCTTQIGVGNLIAASYPPCLIIHFSWHIMYVGWSFACCCPIHYLWKGSILTWMGYTQWFIHRHENNVLDKAV